ncbi:MAG: murein L,D-transpeptidase [Pseudaminobacter sp.]|nr:murein L,D-transpeptidase [Pseudaminobacter sp.]
MNFSPKRASLTAIAVAATLSFGTPSADAQGFFEALFGGGIGKRRSADFPPPPPAPKRKNPARAAGPARIAAPARISAPSYYKYKADALVRVDFAALTGSSQPIAFDPNSNAAFTAAIAGLDGFELFAEKDVAKALTGHYAANPDFIWIDEASINERAREAVRVLSEAESHGLSPADYAIAIPSSRSSLDAGARSQDLMRFEMTLSARVLRYVRDAQGGRVDPNRLSGYHDFPAKPLDMAGVLKTLSHTGEARTFLESRHPQNPEYQALRVEMEALRASPENEIVVDAKLLLKPGGTSPELPKLLQLISHNVDDEFGGEFGEMLWRLNKSEVYEAELVPAIKAVQEKAGLKPDGVIGPRTVAALAGTSKADRLDKVVFALEQLRWLPSDLGSPRVFINQPAFTASFIEGGAEKLKMRVVIGKPSNQTSFFYDEIEQVDYNPYWGVPQSIIVNEMLPRLRRDPGYLDRSGYEVTDSSGRRIPSSAINWGRYGAKVPFNIRQTPSEANALGELKILFPNKHAIYMHDTPQKALFNRDSRAFSHGCVRLKDPRGMAAAVLGTTIEHVEKKLKQGHSGEKVTRKIPVYVAYFTAWPDMHGKVEYFADVYDRDARLKIAMEKTGEMRAPSS